MKGALTRPTESGRIRLVIGETEGIRLKGRHREILSGMKGWRPSAIQKLETGSGSFEAGVFLPDVGSIARFFRGSSVPGLITRGCSVDAGVAFSCSSGSAAAKSDNDAQASATIKRRQPFTSPRAKKPNRRPKRRQPTRGEHATPNSGVAIEEGIGPKIEMLVKLLGVGVNH